MNVSVSAKRRFNNRLNPQSVTIVDISANQTQPANHGRCTQTKGVSRGVFAVDPFLIERSSTGHALTAIVIITPDITIMEKTSKRARFKAVGAAAQDVDTDMAHL